MVQTVSSVTKNMWRRRESGLYAPVRRNFSIDGLVFYAPLWHPQLSVSPFNAWNVADGGVHACTVTGATWGITGRSFDGNDDKIVIPDHASLDITGNITLEIWIQFSTIPHPVGEAIIGKGGRGGAFSAFQLYTEGATTDSLFFGVSLDGVWNSGRIIDNLTQDAWYHIVGLYDGSNFIGYKNSVVDLSAAKTGVMQTNNNDVDIMGQTNFAQGYVGEIRIYNRALSAGEILHNYNSTKWRYV